MLRNVDLNLLQVLYVLLEEKSVSKAAQRCHLSQPAMSHALGRIRDLLRDPILVRSGRNMVLTPQAENLRKPLQKFLADAEALVTPQQPFNPKTAQHHFIVSADDYTAALIAGAVMPHLEASGPGITVEVRHLKQRAPITELAEGFEDCAIRVDPVVAPGIYQKKMLREGFICLLREGHPLEGRKLTKAAYLSLPHILVSPYGGTTGVVDQALDPLGDQRKVKVVVPSFALAPLLVASHDWVATVPKRLGLLWARYLPIRSYEPPLALPSFDVSLVWHERTHKSLAHKWFRDLLITQLAGLD